MPTGPAASGAQAVWARVVVCARRHDTRYLASFLSLGDYRGGADWQTGYAQKAGGCLLLLHPAAISE